MRNHNGYTYYDLYIACPVCMERELPARKSYWQHSDNNCGGGLEIGDDAKLLCSTCMKNLGLMNWKWGCPQHSSGTQIEYVGVNQKDTFVEAITAAGQLTRAAGKEWVTRLLQNL